MSKQVGFMAGLIVLAGLAAMSLPLSNLMRPANPDHVALVEKIQDPQLKKVVPIFQNKCFDCHSANAKLPFYATLPIASDMMRHDIEEGQEHFNLTDKITSNGAILTELDLARLEGVLYNHTMPPLKYTLMHWDAGLSKEDVDVLLSWIRQTRSERYQGMGIDPKLSGEPVQPLPQKMDLNEKKVALGNKLFHDTRLSADNTLSCASCHALYKGGTDRMRFSTGINGQVGGINSPTVFNAVFNTKQFWDGRAADLVEQAAGPVHNPIEMGSNWEQVLAKLKQDAGYGEAFKSLYKDGMTGDNIADAIATFEMSLVTPNSRFDQYLHGKTDALNEDELKGYQLFKVSCASCHAGKNLGGLSFERMGVKRGYFADRGNLTEADNGLFNFTQKESDRHKFKVPTLRNIALTAPYFHDGSTDDLSEAVRIMGKYQVGKNFSEKEVSQIVQFLHTLTGEYNGKPLQ